VALQRDLVLLDQGVREQMTAHPLDLLARGGGVRSLELKVHDTPHAGLVDGESELAERAPNCVALRVEDALFRPDENRRPHESTTSGSERYVLNSMPVIVSNAST
jgi:hypothetical protein